MDIKIHLTGELEQLIRSLVGKGIAESNEEAVIFCLRKYYEKFKKEKS